MLALRRFFVWPINSWLHMLSIGHSGHGITLEGHLTSTGWTTTRDMAFLECPEEWKLHVWHLWWSASIAKARGRYHRQQQRESRKISGLYLEKGTSPPRRKSATAGYARKNRSKVIRVGEPKCCGPRKRPPLIFTQIRLLIGAESRRGIFSPAAGNLFPDLFCFPSPASILPLPFHAACYLQHFGAGTFHFACYLPFGAEPSMLHATTSISALELFILHAICRIWAQEPSIIYHAICRICAQEPFSLRAIGRIWELEPPMLLYLLLLRLLLLCLLLCCAVVFSGSPWSGYPIKRAWLENPWGKCRF